ncbi:hypothetical protein K438DRAFT_1939142 [Mycena galopus ATCC 62051]|nr:hypothetical protein K438DRAFT_1939142 [Mycena galopus ATCC 62051]
MPRHSALFCFIFVLATCAWQMSCKLYSEEHFNAETAFQEFYHSQTGNIAVDPRLNIHIDVKIKVQAQLQGVLFILATPATPAAAGAALLPAAVVAAAGGLDWDDGMRVWAVVLVPFGARGKLNGWENYLDREMQDLVAVPSGARGRLNGWDYPDHGSESEKKSGEEREIRGAVRVLVRAHAIFPGIEEMTSTVETFAQHMSRIDDAENDSSESLVVITATIRGLRVSDERACELYEW